MASSSTISIMAPSSTISIIKMLPLMIVFLVLVATVIGLLRLAKRIIVALRDVPMPLREAGATLGACSFCAKLCNTRCSRCKAAPYYCSELCQSEHWKSGHKHECVKQNADQKRIAEEEARVIERSEQDEHVQMPESDRVRLKTELEEHPKLEQRLKLELKEAQIVGSKVEDISEELASALDDVENATFRAKSKLREYKLIESQILKKNIEERNQELDTAFNDVANANSRAEIAEKPVEKLALENKELQTLVEKLTLENDELQKHVEKLTLEKEEANIIAEETDKNLANTLNRVTILEACVICKTNERDMAFICGHVITCQSCGSSVSSCPICQTWISKRIKLSFH